MPGPNQDLYITTTLSGTTMLLSFECFSHATVTQLVCLRLVDAVVIFTTVICGGLTEPLLKYTKLKVLGLTLI